MMMEMEIIYNKDKQWEHIIVVELQKPHVNQHILRRAKELERSFAVCIALFS